MNIYVTKWALTQGILKMEADKTDETIYPNRTVGTASVPGNPGKSYTQNFHGNEWHPTMSQAIERAEEMRRRKIVSLQKQMEKLQNLKFDIEEN